jgi:hypothetical protein
LDGKSREDEVAAQVRAGKQHNAVNYQDHSAMELLPRESSADFDELRRNLIIEFAPEGPFESDTVASLARLLWRKRNLSTFRRAVWAKERRSEIVKREKARRNLPELDLLPSLSAFWEPRSEADEIAREKLVAAHTAAVQAADEEARKEWGGFRPDYRRSRHRTAHARRVGHRRTIRRGY